MISTPHTSPGLGRRALCALYETVLVAGVVLCASLVYGVVTDQRHALQGRGPLQMVISVVVAAYFIGFWSSQRGQTLAMKTWHVRVVTHEGKRLNRLQAAQRFVSSLIWLVPGVVVMGFGDSPATTPARLGLTFGLSILLYAGLARCLPDRQFLHDVLCHTRLVRTPT
jgi:uncharacterized RDD family membrane protein YckC